VDLPRDDGHLQATGRDARSRKQYRYHPRWREVRDETKYGRMLAFARTLPRIRRRVRQVRVRGSTMQFRFRGKSGVWHEFTLSDRRLAAIVRRMRDLPGYELFQYVDGQGETRAVDAADVNAYLKGVAGEEFTSKDFRTWAGTAVCRKCYIHPAVIDACLDGSLGEAMRAGSASVREAPARAPAAAALARAGPRAVAAQAAPARHAACRSNARRHMKGARQ